VRNGNQDQKEEKSEEEKSGGEKSEEEKSEEEKSEEETCVADGSAGGGKRIIFRGAFCKAKIREFDDGAIVLIHQHVFGFEILIMSSTRQSNDQIV